MRRLLYWLGLLLGVALLAGGVLVAVAAPSPTSDPAAVVRAYFSALSQADARQALAYGTVPRGPHTLLTEAALIEQQRIAPIRNLDVQDVERHGGRATVRVVYDLAFHDLRVPVLARVGVHETSGGWRLDAVAVPTELVAAAARDRETVLGGALPRGRVLMFPGALPIRFDTPYLELDPFRDHVTFDPLSRTYVEVRVSEAGRAAMIAAVRAALEACVAGRTSDAACPLPDERYVPGSVHGRLDGKLHFVSVVVKSADPGGTLLLSGSAVVHGTWQRLDFHNQRVAGRGKLTLKVRAAAYVTQPLRPWWLVS